ncbi:TPA: molecular chaperone, partial [Escherichia coli]
ESTWEEMTCLFAPSLTNATDTKVEFYPASRYGYRGNKYVTDLK